MRWILAATAVTAATLWVAPHPCAAAEHLMGAEARKAPSPGHMRVERQVSLIAAALRYVEDHLGVEIVPASVGRIGDAATPLGLDGPGTPGRPAVAGTFAFGGGTGPVRALNAMSAAVSASQNRLHLTLRMRW